MMEQTPVPFGDAVGIEVLEAIKELGEGLIKLSDVEAVSKTGQPASSSKQFDILQSLNHSVATSRWSEYQQELQRSQMEQEQPNSPTLPPLPTMSPQQTFLLAKKNSFFIASESNDTNDDVPHQCVEEEEEEEGELTTLVDITSNSQDQEFAASDILEREQVKGESPRIDFSMEGSEHDLSMNKDQPLDMNEEEEEEDDDEEEDEVVLRNEEDEWDDDEDLGYVVLKITEQEFFEMEEESAFRQQLGEQRGRSESDVLEGSVVETETETLHDHLDLDLDLVGGVDLEASVHDEEEGDDEDNMNVNTSKRGSTCHRRGDDDDDVQLTDLLLDDREDDRLPPSPPSREDSEEEQEQDSLDANEQRDEEVDEEEDEHEDDIAAVSREMGLVFGNSSETGGPTSLSDLPPIEIDMDQHSEEYEQRDEQEEEQSGSSLPLPPPDGTPPSLVMGQGRMTAQSRRVSEIMGQKKIRGVDGEHCYFDLKVIFNPYRTGFEDDKHFNPPPGTIIAGRYEMVEVLGQAAFSTALRCIDLDAMQPEEEEDNEKSQWVCLKVIKNSKDFFDQSLDEIKLLQYINSKGNPHEHNVLQLIDYFYCKEHLFIVSELLRENLYEFQKYIRESGAEEYFTPNRLKRIMKQILEALVYIHSLNLLHCDIKPENIVIRSYSRCEVKLIDFGSSCFVTDHLTSYIQSRSYRAPEVILGMEYDHGIDIWSLGGVLAEMHTAYVLFQNDSIATMLSRIEGILGSYPAHMVESSPESPKYFNMSGVIYERDEEDGSFALIYAKKTSLRCRLHLPPAGEASEDEELFLEFVRLMLIVDPAQRPSAEQLLTHPWLEGVDDLDVSYNAENMMPPLPTEEDEEDEEEFVCYGERLDEEEQSEDEHSEGEGNQSE